MSPNFSYWEQRSFLAEFDIIIIGSGIVGLSAALRLREKQPSLNIGILEAGFLPSGASTKNAGFACFGSVSEALAEIKSAGICNFLQLVEWRWKGLEKLRKNLGDAAIDFQQHGGYEIFKKAEKERATESISQIENLNSLLQQIIGKHDIYAVDNAKIAEFGFAGVYYIIKNKYEGQIDTGKMMKALIAKAAGLGIQIFNNCKVTQIDNTNQGFSIRTNQDGFRTKSIIIATNAFARELLPELDVIPGRGQVLVTEPIKNLKLKGTFHYNQGYTYFRNINDRILLGGFRDLDFKTEETTKAGTTNLIQSALEDLLYKTILPDKKPEIDYRWSGVMGFGSDLQPIVKKVRPNVYCAVRCNGMGITMGSLIGEQVADLVEL